MKSISGIKVRKKAAVKSAKQPARAEQPAGEQARPTPGGSWTFFSNHSHVLFCLSAQPDMVLREVALRVGITERAVQRIIAELEEAGVLIREKHGRRNRYLIQPEVPLRHPVERHCNVSTLLKAING